MAIVQIDYEFKSEFNERYSLVSRKILRMLSENSRITLSEISKELRISRQAIADRIRRLEKDLGINYTIELNEDKLGLSNPHLILVKFGSKPDYKRILNLFQKSHIPQLVCKINGRYELLVYANAATRQEYVHWDKSTQILLSKYKVLWQPSEVAHRQLGFFPIRNELLDRLEIEPKYKDMIKLLNANSKASFQDISKRLGMHFNTVAYNFKKLLEIGYIKRFTLTMQQKKDLTFMSVFGKYMMSSNFEQDAVVERKALMSDDEYSLISRYIITSQLIGSYDWFSVGVFDNQQVAYKNHVMFYKNAMRRQSVKAVYGAIDKVLLGRLPIRSWDTSRNYNVLKWIPDAQ